VVSKGEAFGSEPSSPYSFYKGTLVFWENPVKKRRPEVAMVSKGEAFGSEPPSPYLFYFFFGKP
jgi:hypothetical protein